MRLYRNLVVALGLVAAQGCTNTDKANKAAANAVEKERAFDRESRDPKAHADTLDKKSAELADATVEFERRRALRVATLRTQHAVIATQPELISTMVQTFPLTDHGREAVGEKLVIFRMRLDEAGNLIASMAKLPPAEFKVRNDAATEAMKRLEQARKDAWKALDDAPRTDRST